MAWDKGHSSTTALKPLCYLNLHHTLQLHTSLSIRGEDRLLLKGPLAFKLSSLRWFAPLSISSPLPCASYLPFMDPLPWYQAGFLSLRLVHFSSWNQHKKRAVPKTRLSRVPLAVKLRSLILTRKVTCDDAMRRRSIATVTQQPATSSSHYTPFLTLTPAKEGSGVNSGVKGSRSLDAAFMQFSLKCVSLREEIPLWNSTVCSSKEGLVSLEDVRDTAGSISQLLKTQGRHVGKIEDSQTKPLEEVIMVDDGYSDTSTLVEGGSPICDFQREREIICHYLRDSRNIVDESPDPESTPHIVITQPEEYWEDQFIPWLNRLDYQWVQGGNLIVPPLSLSTGRLQSADDQVSPFAGQVLATTPLSQPPQVFPLSDAPKVLSLSKLPWHGMSIPEEIYKRLFEIAAAEASDFAYPFRLRYDTCVKMFASFERSYTWTDPAEPILASSGFGSIILESSCPFQAPHIIIHPTPFFSPPEENRTPPLQDAAFGRLLTVQSCMVQVVNELESWSDDESSDDDMDADELSEEDYSHPESPMPRTPLDEELGDFDYLAETHSELLQELEDLIEWDGGQPDDHAIGGLDTSIPDKPSRPSSSSSTCCPDPEFRIEEDEDELPSLDDW